MNLFNGLNLHTPKYFIIWYIKLEFYREKGQKKEILNIVLQAKQSYGKAYFIKKIFYLNLNIPGYSNPHIRQIIY